MLVDGLKQNDYITKNFKVYDQAEILAMFDSYDTYDVLMSVGELKAHLRRHYGY